MQDMQEVRKRTEKAQAWQEIAKLYRSAIRLRHSLKADVEINDGLEPLQARFEKIYDAGDGYTFDSDRLTLRKARSSQKPASPQGLRAVR